MLGHSSLFPAFFLGSVIEILLAVKWPQVLAFLARIPFARRDTITLSPAVHRALTVHSEAASYREVAPSRIDLTKLVGPSVVRGDDHEVSFFLDRGLVVARDLMGLTRRWRGVVRVDLHAERERLVLTSGYYPVGLIAGLCFVFSFGTSFPVPLVARFLFPAFIVLVGCVGGHGRAKRTLAAARHELEARVAALEPRSPVRIEGSAEVQDLAPEVDLHLSRKAS